MVKKRASSTTEEDSDMDDLLYHEEKVHKRQGRGKGKTCKTEEEKKASKAIS